MLAAGTPGAICTELPGPWFTVRHYLTDLSGNSIPIRTGKSDQQAAGGPDSGANYNHASVDHNLCNDAAFAAMFGRSYRKKPTDSKGERYKYDAVVVDSDYHEYFELEGIASTSKEGFGDKTPDGRPFGMVTAYCLGYTKCPDTVNQIK